ncbi:cell adhesion molecule 3-like [Phymastichus coffea]|uniref:cell adhesion molecule 3-like n=1 Tax=Phymastichus coffea TaxID=108790 RepID=UPI00273AA90C|nr:cell adhesion molecule 3-like [Phymastichus coffea]
MNNSNIPGLLLTIGILLLMYQVGALKLLEISVPPYLRRGESARLECRYDLESDKLYSVSWYKDHEHIYSYLRKSGTKKAFTVEGVKIDTYKSNNQALQLLNVSLNSTGYYACEVHTETKPFKSVKGDAYMEVVEVPREDPKITGEEKIYASGDILALNCTSGFSFPAAQLQWFVNDVPIDDPDQEVIFSTSRGLHSTRSSLRLELNPLHLAEERIQVKCISTVRTTNPEAPFVDTRMTKIYVQGYASLSSPSTSLLMFTLLLLTLSRRH